MHIASLARPHEQADRPPIRNLLSRGPLLPGRPFRISCPERIVYVPRPVRDLRLPEGSKTMSGSLEELAKSVGEQLRKDAEPIVSQWIDWVRSRVRTPTINALPEKALRNHIPPVVLALADYISNPIHAMRETMLGHLRIHGQIRRDQGYAIQEVLSEFDGLSYMITTKVGSFLRDSGEGLEDAVEVSSRLATGLRAISFACVSAYQESDERLRQSLSAELEEFSRAVAHELRNPLNTVNLLINSLRNDKIAEDEDKRTEQLDVMQSAVVRASQFLDNIRLLAIASAAQAGEALTDLATAVDTARHELGELAQEAQVDIRVGELPDVKTESIVLHIVLVNLIGNAIKYCDREKEERFVEVSAELVPEEHDSGFCHLLVRDNGIGVDEELLPRLMQSGFRASPESGQGTGLGLHIIQKMLNDRGGSVRIESEKGVGTTVMCRFRCLEASPGGRNDMQMHHLVELSVEEALRNQQEADKASK